MGNILSSRELKNYRQIEAKVKIRPNYSSCRLHNKLTFFEDFGTFFQIVHRIVARKPSFVTDVYPAIRKLQLLIRIDSSCLDQTKLITLCREINSIIFFAVSCAVVDSKAKNSQYFVKWSQMIKIYLNLPSHNGIGPIMSVVRI